MSRFWIALSLLLTMLGLSLVNAVYLTDLAESITVRLQAAEEMAERDAWDQADAITTQCLNDWNGYHTYLHIISRHSDTDEILISFRSVLQSLKLQEMDEEQRKKYMEEFNIDASFYTTVSVDGYFHYEN